MLLPEARLDTLIEQFEGLPLGDRKAILARLSGSERARLLARMRPAPPLRPASPYSLDITQRLDALTGDGDLSVTPTGRAALAKAAEALRGDTPTQPAESLFDAVLGMVRQIGARR